MPQGDAFNRNEVSSVYVRASARYVVSLIVGMEAEEISSPEAAVAAVLELTRGQDRKSLVWHVHDRETGVTKEVEQSIVEDDDEAAPNSETA